MDNTETLLQNNASGKEGITFVGIFRILRAHLILILFITAIFGAGGFAYSKVKKPTYTASVPVSFITAMENESGDTNQVASTNYLFAYLDTAVGICRSGEVLDRANVYYNFYKKSGLNINEFVLQLKNAYTAEVRSDRGEIPGYEIDETLKKSSRNKYFTSSNSGTNYSSKKSTDTVSYFKLWVKHSNSKTAREMALVYVVAADVALNQILDLGQGTAGLIDLAETFDNVSSSSDVSPRNIIIISVVLGFVVSLIIVYLLFLSDNTVRSKEQLEKLTGANVIAYLDDVAEVK